MDRSDIISLVKEVQTQDKYGVWRKSYTKRDVYCSARSVTASEFFDGGRNGLNPEYQFTMFGPDYEGERIVEYKGQTYAVYRTYQTRTDELELYVEREGGTNGVKQS